MKRPNQLKSYYNDKIQISLCSYRYRNYFLSLKEIVKGNKRLKKQQPKYKVKPISKPLKKRKLRKLGLKIKLVRIHFKGFRNFFRKTFHLSKLFLDNQKTIKSIEQSKKSKSHEIFQTKDKRYFIALFKKEAGFNNR